MEFMLDIPVQPVAKKINYQDRLLLVGSCFTEHIGQYLKELKFDLLNNPNGILFDTQSVATSLLSYIHNQPCTEKDLSFFNELWQSWQHHSFFSDMDQDQCLEMINASRNLGHEYLKTANWLIITLGSSFSYRLVENNQPVANCHRAPAQWFRKHLMSIEEMNSVLDNCLYQLFQFNPNLQIIFTVSPVRHIRDGVVENNRSKARLIEVVHHLVNKFDRLSYFPAYEWVIDVLRDYRFFDTDMVHPNYQATEFVLQKFVQQFMDSPSQTLMQEIRKIVTARKHKAFQPATHAHEKFLKTHLEKAKQLSQQHPYLDFTEEINYFSIAE
ncbi:MAG: GSCFA domain-containing protein [Bacteroidetes bacterium]|nr:GSCFA domain-containing protein [Bacteroidota bacterium]